MQWIVLHTVLSFTHTMCFCIKNIDIRCFVARQFLSQIYALLSVKFSGVKKCWCKYVTNMRYASMRGIFHGKLLRPVSEIKTLCRMCKTWNGGLCKWLLTIGAKFKWETSLQWALKLNALKSSRIAAPSSSTFIEHENSERGEN